MKIDQRVAVGVIVFAVIGTLLLISGFAAAPFTGVEAENTVVNSPAQEIPDEDASEGSFVSFSNSQGSEDIAYYGIQYTGFGDGLDRAQELGANLILEDFVPSEGPAGWLRKLDLAQSRNLKVVTWYSDGSNLYNWPRNSSNTDWVINAQARNFLTTVQDHPALFAVYGTHEAYWNQCEGCGYTSDQLRDLHDQIKAIADVKVYSSFSDFYYYKDDPLRMFSDGICDYCDTWLYPVWGGGVFNLDRYNEKMAQEIAVFKERAPNSKFFWVLQAFRSDIANRDMPNLEQMRIFSDIAVKNPDIDGFWWYTWNFGDVYQEILSEHPELHPIVPEAYQNYFDHIGVDPCSVELGQNLCNFAL